MALAFAELKLREQRSPQSQKATGTDPQELWRTPLGQREALQEYWLPQCRGHLLMFTWHLGVYFTLLPQM